MQSCLIFSSNKDNWPKDYKHIYQGYWCLENIENSFNTLEKYNVVENIEHDETKYKFKRSCYLNRTHFKINRYGLWHSGWKMYGVNGVLSSTDYPMRFGNGNIVCMMLDLYKGTLSFTIKGMTSTDHNVEEYKVVFDDCNW